MTPTDDVRKYMAELGKKGGSVKSPRRAAANAQNAIKARAAKAAYRANPTLRSKLKGGQPA